MSTVLAALPGLAWLEAADGTLRVASAGLVEYTGLAAAELAGRGWSEHVHPDDRERLAAARGGTAKAEARLRRRDGTWRRHAIRWTAHAGGWLAAAHDTETERELAELLQRSEERRLHLARAVDFSVWDWDLRAEQATPGSWLEQIHAADRDRVAAGIHEAIASGRGRWVDEFRFHRRDGTTGIAIGRATLVHDSDGTPIRMIGGTTDVTAQRRAEASRDLAAQQLRGLTAASAALTTPASLQVVLETVGELARDLAGAPHAVAWLVDEQPAEAAAPDTHEVPIVDRAGAPLGRIAITGGAPRAPELLAPLARMAGIAIENLHLVRQLEQLVAEAKDADRRKDEFLAMLAHELRNPLAPVRTAVDLMKVQPTPPSVGRYVGIIERQIGRLTRLVDDLLDVSRITRGRIELQRQPLAVRDLVTGAVESTASAVEGKGHALQVQLPAEPLWVDGDPARLEQVLVNLIVNAAKYTDAGGTLTLTASREGGELVLSLCDTGVGIAAEMLGQIFELFGQVPQSLDRSDGGLGLGLTIVKRLVEMHGGTVIARSDGVGCGSEFIVRLPLIDPPVRALD